NNPSPGGSTWIREQRSGHGIICDPGGRGCDADAQSSARYLYVCAVSAIARRDGRSNEPLHTGRTHTDNVVGAIFQPDPAEREYIDQGDGVGERVFEQCGGEWHVHDWCNTDDRACPEHLCRTAVRAVYGIGELHACAAGWGSERGCDRLERQHVFSN